MDYIRNKDLIPVLAEYKRTGIISNQLAEMFYLIARNLSNKSNWSGYSWKSDLVQEAVLTCVKYIKNFDIDKSQNPFAYITQICSNSFKQFVKKQKKHSEIKDTCYKEVDRLEERVGTFNDRAIDYTILVKDKPKNEIQKLHSGEDSTEGS